MADPNSVVVHDRKLVVMMICKAGNTSIKRALGDALEIPKLDVPENLEPHRRLDLHLPTPNRMDAWNLRKCGYTVVSVIRHPLARLVSCWRDKVAGKFHHPFRRKYGEAVWQGMPFGEFVDFVAGTPDGIADQHFRSMSRDLTTHDGNLIPEHVFRIEDGDWWKKLRATILETGLDIGPQRRENATGGGRDWRGHYTAQSLNTATERYRRDLSLFGYDA
jgi:hypothetical protein